MKSKVKTIFWWPGSISSFFSPPFSTPWSISPFPSGWSAVAGATATRQERASNLLPKKRKKRGYSTARWWNFELQMEKYAQEKKNKEKLKQRKSLSLREFSDTDIFGGDFFRGCFPKCVSLFSSVKNESSCGETLGRQEKKIGSNETKIMLKIWQK